MVITHVLIVVFTINGHVGHPGHVTLIIYVLNAIVV